MRWWRRRSVPVDVGPLVAAHLEAGDPTGWFEPAYAAAAGDAGRLPWTLGTAHPYLVDWLDQPPVPVPGPRALVIGCGAGDDAVELASRGFEVTAFDVAPSAVRIARARAPQAEVTWTVADLLEAPAEWSAAFDLVVEVSTVPWLPGVVRDAAMQEVGGLVAPGGVAVVVTLLATSADVEARVDGPPWPQAPAELAAYQAGGLTRVALEHPPPDDSGDAVEVRLTLTRR